MGFCQPQSSQFHVKKTTKNTKLECGHDRENLSEQDGNSTLNARH